MSNEDKIARVSALWYMGLSALLALLFYAVTTVQKYPPAARYGGAVWVFILTVIILMPLVIPRVKRKYR